MSHEKIKTFSLDEPWEKVYVSVRVWLLDEFTNDHFNIFQRRQLDDIYINVIDEVMHNNLQEKTFNEC